MVTTSLYRKKYKYLLGVDLIQCHTLILHSVSTTPDEIRIFQIIALYMLTSVSIDVYKCIVSYSLIPMSNDVESNLYIPGNKERLCKVLKDIETIKDGFIQITNNNMTTMIQ